MWNLLSQSLGNAGRSLVAREAYFRLACLASIIRPLRLGVQPSKQLYSDQHYSDQHSISSKLGVIGMG